LRIAFFSETFLPKVDGVVHTLCHLLRHLETRGHTAKVFAPEGGPPEYAGASVIGLPAYRFPLYPEIKLVPPLVSVGHQLRRFAPDLVHLANPFLVGLAGLRHAMRLGLPIVASYHTDLPAFFARWGYEAFGRPLWAYARYVHNKADLNLCPSETTRGYLRDHGIKRVGLWTRGVDTERFSPGHRTREWREKLTGGHPDAPLLLYVGRLAPEKRLDWLLQVLGEIPGARLALVGDGPQRTELEARFPGTATVFTGYIRGLPLAQAYASADVFVFPAMNETFGNVVLEAMGSGLPVVAAGAGGPLDIVRDGENGFLFDPDDPADLVRSTEKLVRNPELRKRMGGAARAYAETRQWPDVLDELLSDYREVVEASQTAHTGRNEPEVLGRASLVEDTP